MGKKVGSIACSLIQKSTKKIWKIWDEIWSDLAFLAFRFWWVVLSSISTQIPSSHSPPQKITITLPFSFLHSYSFSTTPNQISSFLLFFVCNIQSFVFPTMGMAVEAQFHVLAVDDSIIDRKLIERLLKTSSYQVTTVDSGSKALEYLSLFEYDHEQRNQNPLSVSSDLHQEMEVNLIITDYCMPGMTGYDLLKKIKESSSLKDIPVVIMSSENVPSRINRCLEEGAEEFFLKPVKLSDVNKLKPHLLKGKSKEPKQIPPQTQISQKPELEKDLQPSTVVVQQQQQQQLQPQPQPQPQPQQVNNNKRKAMEEGLSPDRTRPRYTGSTTGLTMV